MTGFQLVERVSRSAEFVPQPCGQVRLTRVRFPRDHHRLASPDPGQSSQVIQALRREPRSRTGPERVRAVVRGQACLAEESLGPHLGARLNLGIDEVAEALRERLICPVGVGLPHLQGVGHPGKAKGTKIVNVVAHGELRLGELTDTASVSGASRSGGNTFLGHDRQVPSQSGNVGNLEVGKL